MLQDGTALFSIEAVSRARAEVKNPKQGRGTPIETIIRGETFPIPPGIKGLYAVEQGHRLKAKDLAIALLYWHSDCI
jgi:hypothetical protein